MPYFGLLPFLLITGYLIGMFKYCFNALLRASSFSTTNKFDADDDGKVFQCPTSGFFLFYHPCNFKGWRGRKHVSMPYFGLLPFLQQEKWRYHENKRKFQCPTSGFFLFYAMSLQPLILLAFQPPFCK